MGELDKAEEMFRQAIRVFREVGDIQGLSAASGNLGDVFLAKGDLDAAERALSSAIPGYKEIGDKDGIALTLNDLGEIARLRGDLSEAQQRYDQAKSSAQEIDEKRALAYIASGLGDVLFDRGNLAGAQEHYQDSLALRKQIGDQQAVAESEVSLGRLAVEQGHAAEAETVIRKCREQFHQGQQADDELSASTALVEVLLAQSKYADANYEVNQSAPLARKSSNLLLHLQFDLASARVESASGNSQSAEPVLEKTLQSAKAHKLFCLELQARLAISESKAKAGQLSSAQADSRKLEELAHKKGFEFLALKARRSSQQN
jgi:tetratricopeptide (TPR) repeat protein